MRIFIKLSINYVYLSRDTNYKEFKLEQKVLSNKGNSIHSLKIIRSKRLDLEQNKKIENNGYFIAIMFKKAKGINDYKTLRIKYLINL